MAQTNVGFAFNNLRVDTDNYNYTTADNTIHHVPFPMETGVIISEIEHDVTHMMQNFNIAYIDPAHIREMLRPTMDRLREHISGVMIAVERSRLSHSSFFDCWSEVDDDCEYTDPWRKVGSFELKF